MLLKKLIPLAFSELLIFSFSANENDNAVYTDKLNQGLMKAIKDPKRKMYITRK